ncbi:MULTISPECIES: hypothetical protein [Prevotellaceae]|uniref:hypothetical protein n=1 Tax=Prevotellaceae TaxID=171552 RepID=UPI00098103C1|nr:MULTISPECIES: hypothetical protein [Prevotellaceae]
MKEVINIQETTREKKQYVRPQITMIPMQAEHALLAGSGKGPGGGSLEGGEHGEIPSNPDED